MTSGPLFEALGWTMVHFLWAGAAVWLASRGVLAAIPASAAASRHAAALGGLAALGALPVLIFALHSGGAGGDRRAEILAGPESGTTGRALSGLVRMAPAVGAGRAPGTAVGPGEDSWQDRIIPSLPWIWLLGTTAMFAALACGGAGVRRLERDALALGGGPWFEVFTRLRARAGSGRDVLLAASARILSPVVVGVLRPVILVPVSLLTGLTPDEVEMVLRHELAHVRRRDNLVNLGQRILEAVLFFHPAVWSLSRQVRREREACCDGAALEGSGRRQDYAALLLRLLPAGAGGLPASALSGPDVLIRIRRILEQESPMPRLRRVIALAGAAAGILVLVVAARAQVHAGGSRAAATQEPPGADGRPAGAPAIGATAAVPGRGTGTGGGVGEGSGAGAGAGIAAGHACPRATMEQVPDSSCKDCHADPHLRATEVHARAGASGQDCRSCHASVPGPFDPHRTAPAKRPWGPEHACGAPDTPEAGDHPTAWASETPDAESEWLELRYDEAVTPVAVVIHESFNPGSVCRVVAMAADGREVGIWSGNSSLPAEAQSWTTVIPVGSQLTTQRIRIELASSRIAGWNEIDAVGLRVASGKVHWASAATASTTYAGAARPAESLWAHRWAVLSPPETDRLRRELEATRQRLEEALRRLAELERRAGNPK